MSLGMFLCAVLQGITNASETGPARRQTVVGDAHLLDCNLTAELLATCNAVGGGAFLAFGHGKSVAGA